MTTAVVLELPGKGAYAPTKFGCRSGSFIKTKLPGEGKYSWVYEGKVYELSDPKQISAFNAMCEKIVPHCHRRRMRVIPRVFILPEVEKKEESPMIITRSSESYQVADTPSFEDEPLPVAKKKRAKRKVAIKSDSPPSLALATPPSGE
jgi:hypothetical protein